MKPKPAQVGDKLSLTPGGPAVLVMVENSVPNATPIRIAIQPNQNTPHVGLSVRASNCLRALKLMGRPAIARAMRRGELHPSNPAARTIGMTTYVEIRKWLGMPVPLNSKNVKWQRGRLAAELRGHGFSFEDINTILRLGGKEQARQMVAFGERRCRGEKKPCREESGCRNSGT